MDVRVGPWRKLSAEELMLLNCGVGEDCWESLDYKEIQPVHPKGDQSWVFIGRTDVETETPILWPPDGKSWLIWKDPDAGKDWRQEEKGTTEDEMVRWRHRLDGHGFGWTPGVGDGQGGLVCCSSWGRKELDMTEQLNWTELRKWLIWLTLPWSSELITPLTQNFQSALEHPAFKYECMSKPDILGEILSYKILGTKPIHRGK